MNINIYFYDIDEQFEIIGDIPKDSCLLYVNYFGIKQEYVEQLIYGQLIIDNSQAFFPNPEMELILFTLRVSFLEYLMEGI